MQYHLYIFVEDKNNMIALCPNHSHPPVFDTFHCAEMEGGGLRDLVTYRDIG